MKRSLWILALTLLAACGSPRDEGGKVYLPQFSLPYGESRVLVFSYPKLKYLGEIESGRLAMRAVKRPGSDELWVSCESSRDIAVIDTRGDSLILRFSIGQVAQGGAFTPDGSVFVVAHGAQIAKRKGSHQASIVDAASRELVATFETGVDPFSVAVSPDGREAYVANHGDHTITRIDLPGQRVIDTVETGPGPYSLTVDPTGDKLYAACRGKDAQSAGSFFVHALPDLKIIEDIASDRHPVQLLRVADATLFLEASTDPGGSIRRMPSEPSQLSLDSWILELDAHPGLAKISDCGRWMLVSLGGSEIACVDLDTGLIASRRTLPNSNLNHIVMDLELVEFSP